jgi:conjugative relaxase-like TrwC/TraI family protein
MISHGKVQSADYYLTEDIDQANYYLDRSESQGRWLGELATKLGLEGPVNDDAFRAMLDGRHPITGEAFADTQRRVAAHDFTFSLPKSFSLLWALGTPEEQSAVEGALKEGVDAALKYLEQTSCHVRRGHAGAEVYNGEGFLAANFFHRTSRAGDPGPHSHVVIANMTVGPDERTTALDARPIFKERYTADAIFQAVVRGHLARNAGTLFLEPNQHGVAEVAGISDDAIRTFSKRRVQVLDEMQRRGTHTAQGARVAALVTRPSKPTPVTEEQLRARWQAEAQTIGLSLRHLNHMKRDPQLRVDDHTIAEAVTERAAHHQRRDAIRAIAHNAIQGATLDQLEARTEAYLSSGTAVPLNDTRWTTTEMLTIEQRAIDTATRTIQRAPTIDKEHLEAALANRPTLSEEQARMVTSIATSGRTVDVVRGHAGAGKTFAVDALRESAEHQGLTLIGTAPSARAAKELRNGTGIPAITAASLVGELQSGRTRFDDRTIVIVDEAAMLGTRHLATIIEAASKANAKVVCIGDDHQLPEVDAGGLFTALANRLPPITLTENRRQRDPHEQAALLDLRHGRIDEAIGTLQRNGIITTADNAELLRSTLVNDWHTAESSGKHAVMTASNRADVADLNERARELLIAEGQLGPVATTIGDTELRIGDKVIAHRNRYDLGILNGDTGEVTAADKRYVHIATEDDRTLRVPNSYVAEGLLTHAYATTVHKAQGMTCDETFVLGDDGLYNELGYTGLSRGRDSNRLYAVTGAWETKPGDADDPLAHLRSALSTSRAQTAAIDITTDTNQLTRSHARSR